MGKKVVYILGAGASVQAIPAYNTFIKSMDKFMEVVKLWTYSIKNMTDNEKKLFGEIPDNYLAILDTYIEVFNESRYFGTPDTYAVSIKDDSIKLRALKKLVSAFLYLLHFEIDTNLTYIKDVITVALFPIYELPTTDDIDKPVYGNHLDRRYVSFWSSVFSHTDFENINDLKFITWNYDLQLAKSLYLFIKNKNKVESFVSNNVLQLNGSCRISSSSDIYSRILTKDDFAEIMKYLFTKENSRLGIKFSWEADTNKLLDKAQEFINGARAVSLIGYSVPDYNRLSDISLVKHITSQKKKVYIQDLKPDLIRRKLATINKPYFTALDDSINVRTNGIDNPNTYHFCDLVSDTSQFIIPEEYWV